MSAAAGRAARRNWLLTVLLCIGLGLRVLASLAYRPALLYIDSDRYLRGIYSLDPVGYRIMLWPLQRAGGLAAVAAVQHALGLAIACVIYAVLTRRGIGRHLAAVAVAPVLLDGYQLQAEQMIMPDVMFEALIVAGLAALLWRRNPATWQFAVAGLMLGTAVDVRQVGEALIAPALVFVLVRTGKWRDRLAAGALVSVAFAVPVLAYMTGHWAVNGQFSITERNSYILYGRAASVADCATLRLPADERALCPTRQEVAALGIDGLVGDPASPLFRYQPPPGTSTEEMAGRFDHAVVTQQPAAVLGAVDRDVLKLFALTRDRSPGDPPIARWQFQPGYPVYPPVITLHYVATVRPGGSPARVSRPLAALLRGYQLDGGYTPGPLLALAAIAGLAGMCALDRTRRRHADLAVACLLPISMAVAVLLVSDAYEFSWRYQLPALILLPPAGMLGVVAIIAKVRYEMAEWRVSHGRLPGPEPVTADSQPACPPAVIDAPES
jgi:hypothetical protein